MFATRIAITCLVIFVVAAERLSGQDAVTSARDLYASAQYDEALKVLDGIAPAASSINVRQSIELYRTLCLLALGRRDDADRAIERIVVSDPLYRPGDDLSPRTRALFTDARKRLLPAIVQQQYTEAKTAFDRKQWESAATGFRRVIEALNDPDMGPAAAQPPLSDIRTLAAGFYDLSVNSIPPPPPPPPIAAAKPEPAANVPPRIYSGDDAGVRPPINIAQDIPRYPGAVPLNGLLGIIEVVVNEKGTVDSAAMIVRVNSTYDKLVLNAASKWQFQPAMVNGVPVKFRKRIQISIRPPSEY